jgi:hypothetical protein
MDKLKHFKAMFKPMAAALAEQIVAMQMAVLTALTAMYATTNGASNEKKGIAILMALVTVAIVIFTFVGVLFFNYEVGMAAQPAGGDAGVQQWNAIINMLLPWINRLGAVVMLLGGIMFGLAFKNDDADGKTRALQTLVAGGVVIAVGAGATQFLGITPP